MKANQQHRLTDATAHATNSGTNSPGLCYLQAAEHQQTSLHLVRTLVIWVLLLGSTPELPGWPKGHCCSVLWFPHLENAGAGLKILKEIMPRADQEVDGTKSASCDAA